MMDDAIKQAMVTGAGGVLGRSVAKLLAKEGYRVVVVDVETAALESLVEEIGDETNEKP